MKFSDRPPAKDPQVSVGPVVEACADLHQGRRDEQVPRHDGHKDPALYRRCGRVLGREIPNRFPNRVKYGKLIKWARIQQSSDSVVNNADSSALGNPDIVVAPSTHDESVVVDEPAAQFNGGHATKTDGHLSDASLVARLLDLESSS